MNDKYTAEQIDACILCYKSGDLNYCRQGIIDLLSSYATLLRERESAKTEVSKAIVETSCKAAAMEWEGMVFPDAYSIEEADNLRKTMRAALEAVAPMLAGTRVPDGWRQDVALAASMLTWGAEEGLTESQERDVRTHQAKLFSMLAAAPKTETEE